MAIEFLRVGEGALYIHERTLVHAFGALNMHLGAAVCIQGTVCIRGPLRRSMSMHELSSSISDDRDTGRRHDVNYKGLGAVLVFSSILAILASDLALNELWEIMGKGRGAIPQCRSVY